MNKLTYVGLDVRAATIVIALLEEGQERAEVREIPNDAAVIRNSMQRLGKGRQLRCCYQMVAPLLIPQKPGDCSSQSGSAGDPAKQGAGNPAHAPGSSRGLPSAAQVREL